MLLSYCRMRKFPASPAVAVLIGVPLLASVALLGCPDAPAGRTGRSRSYNCPRCGCVGLCR